jgi:carbon monoxide dehydrogenase subunit G
VIEHAETIVVARPLDEVFAFMSDFTHVPEWESTTESVEITTAGPTRAGTTGVQVRRIAHVHMSAPFEVVAYDPAGHMTIHSKTGTAEVTGTFDCREVPDGTEVRVAMQLKLGLRLRLAEPVIRVAVEHEARVNVQRLKLLLEG